MKNCKSFIKYVWACVFAFSTPALAQNKPNVVYILCDDLGYGDISALNKASKLITPNVDKLAAEGMVFTDAHSSSAVCTPTRYGVLTGRYNWRTKLQSGVLGGNSLPLIKKDEPTIATFLRANGYSTAAIGKWHLGLGWQKDDKGQIDFTLPITDGPVDHGFDYFFGISASLDMAPYVYIENNRSTSVKLSRVAASERPAFYREGLMGHDFKHIEVLPTVTKKAVSYIKTQAKSNKPFFLYLPLPAPHTPILPTKPFQGKSKTNSYGDFVLMVDDVVGQVKKAVNDAGIADNTIIIFTSDNGCSPEANFKDLATFGHNPSYVFRGTKADIYEGGHHVPFIATWPGKIKAGSVADSTICLTDFVATMADILNTGLDDNTGVDSYSLLPLMVPHHSDKFQRNYTIHHSISGGFSIRKGKWKLEFSAGSAGWSSPTPSEVKKMDLPAIQLYDLSTDIAEQKM